MPQNIHIRSTDCDGPLQMYAKPDVIKDNKGEVLKFHNQVKSDNPIEIKFYLLNKKGEPGEEIEGFCTNEMGSTDTVLSIEKNKQKDCTLPTNVTSKYYAYTVDNADAPTLDPVIIIDDALDPMGDGGFGLFFMLLAGAGGAVVGAFGGHYFKSKRSAAS